MKSFFQEYFYYSRAERNGAFILALLCLGLFLLPKVYPHLVGGTGAGYEQYQDEALAFFKALQAVDSSHQPLAGQLFYFDPNTISLDSLLLLGLPPKTAGTVIRYRDKVGPFYRAEDLRKVYTLAEEDYRRLAPYVRLAEPPSPAALRVKLEWEQENSPSLQPFPFDPNTATAEELNRLGLPERLAGNILKYREKGGRFRKPDALKKIYGMDEDTYRALEPFIQVEEKGPPAREEPALAEDIPEAYGHAPAPLAIDINTASEEEWRQLYGIGPGYARRIVRFREKLGGFARIEQVGETYGLPDSTFQKIRPQLLISPPFRRLNINTADAQTLKAHPYLDWRMANAIVNYRVHHGPFKDIEALRKVKALPAEVVERLGPYLEWDGKRNEGMKE
ncbi:MAG: helix-hairpin-helix domain-containing protein [Phaeodactylibacter sp.]|nr:helix-hairpin-helix domain-containing protein [Phaeodactylibacter sp.]